MCILFLEKKSGRKDVFILKMKTKGKRNSPATIAYLYVVTRTTRFWYA